MLRLPSMATLAVVTAFSFLASSASAQYSSSAAAPLVVRATGFDDVQPKFAAAPDGGKYVSFFSGSGYDVMLARLDASGNFVWKTQSIMVADRGNSSTTDYGLASDAAGNAYLAFDGVNGTTPAILVQAVSPSGVLSWKSIVTESTTAYIAVGRVTVASDGGVWACHIQDTTTRVQRFDASTGVKTFAAPIIISEASNNQLSADIQPSIDGAVIVSCVRYTTFNGAKVLRAHRVNLDGSKPWVATGVPVFTTGSLQFGAFPAFISDGAGGAYFTWYTSSPLQSSVQRVSEAGVPMYGASGISVTTTTTSNRVNPSSVLGADGRLYTFWAQQTPNTSFYGIYGQCFLKGARMWGIDGLAVAPLSTVYSRDSATATRLGDFVGCFYVDNASAVASTIRCAKLTTDGAILTTDVATNSGVKYRLSAASATDAGAVVCWQGGVSTGASDVYAARIGADGILGPPPAIVIGDLNGDGLVDAADLAILLGAWGGTGAADLDGNGTVDAADLATLLGAWTPA
ncbi:MAG: hypothetical protein DWI11_11940 [Planctomycetota bacterium]|nr:MAG: hypothetical protein DWI11_11940 [Planctomycetota bacterium]